jgi:hypothetical protein
MQIFGILKPFLVHNLEPIGYNEGKRKKGYVLFIFLGQCICHYIVFSILENDLIIITKELSHPFLFLLEGNALFHKVLEALMVGLDLETLPQEIMAPQINDMHNSQHFLFINGFAYIPFRQFLAGEGQRSTLLHKESVDSFPRGITFQHKGLCEIRKGQNQSGAHGCLQGLKSLSSRWSPIERVPF